MMSAMNEIKYELKNDRYLATSQGDPAQETLLTMLSGVGSMPSGISWRWQKYDLTCTSKIGQSFTLRMHCTLLDGMCFGVAA